MFIELHKPGTITINVNMIPNCNGSIVVEELIEKCLKK